MANKYVVEKKININASVNKLWEVLTTADYIRQWDDLPAAFTEKQLHHGSTIAWEMEERTTKLTVISFEPFKELKLALYVSRWPAPESTYNIVYHYELNPNGGVTTLTIRIGDFAALGPMAQDYYDASVEFADTGGDKIKQLAEQS